MSFFSYCHLCWEIARQQTEGVFFERHYPLLQNCEGKYIQWKDFSADSLCQTATNRFLPPAFPGPLLIKNAASSFLGNPVSFWCAYSRSFPTNTVFVANP